MLPSYANVAKHRGFFFSEEKDINTVLIITKGFCADVLFIKSRGNIHFNLYDIYFTSFFFLWNLHNSKDLFHEMLASCIQTQQ